MTSQNPEKSNAQAFTLPASWYRSPALYSLERRAIFSKHWLQTTHQNRFVNPGDFIRYDFAGYNFFIVKGKAGELRAFHNVCRHRAFPVLREDQGNKRILGCGYHGWSYALDGSLTKAPRFQDDPDFKKEDYSLFAIHLRVDRCGFVWVNLDSATEPEVKWEEQTGGIDTQERLGIFDMKEYVYDHSWGFKAEYDWKLMVDNYNECYHCPIAHPGIAATTDLPNYTVTTHPGYIAHFARPKPEFATADNADVAPTYVFPSSAATINKVYMYLTRCVPTGAGKVSMEFEVYRHGKCGDEEFTEMDEFMKSIEEEDRVLCSQVQTSLVGGVYTAGPLHAREEKGVRYVQGMIREALERHRRKEEDVGREIWPAERKGAGISDGQRQVDQQEDFCEKLCRDTMSSKLGW